MTHHENFDQKQADIIIIIIVIVSNAFNSLLCVSVCRDEHINIIND